MAEMEEDLGAAEVLSNETGVAQTVVSLVSSSSDDARALLQRICKYIVHEKASRDKLKANVTSLRRERVNADQQFNQLEKQLISCNSKLNLEINSHESIKKQLEETSKKLEINTEKLHEVQTIKENAETVNSHVSHQNENLEAEKLNLLASLDRKNKEIDRLNGEWKSMLKKVDAASLLQYEAKAKLDELESKDISCQLREKRLEQEKGLLKSQNEWLDSQLKEKSEAYFAIKKDKSSNVQQLQSDFDAKVKEVEHLEALVESLKTANEELTAKVNSYMEKVKDARELQTKTEEQYKLEVSSQSKLTMLYKDSAEESNKKCNEFARAMEELQRLSKIASTGRVEAEGKLKESEANYSDTVKEYDEKLESLQNELKIANDLLEAARKRGAASMSAEDLAVLSPAAAATSKFLKSGMTLTQIYNQHVETLDLLWAEKAENTRLKGYMDEILQDIQEKAPLLLQQRKDYESTLVTNDKLIRKLQSAMVECERFNVETSEAMTKSEYLKRENERMKMLTVDLGNQVKVLLKECEEATGRVVSRDDSRVDMLNDEVSSSSEVITEHLVTFRNIEELQEQNQKILIVIRELSDKRESEENLETNKTKYIGLKSKLDEALSELEELKAARARQVEMVEAVVRQRDMYKVMLSNTNHAPIAPQVVEISMTTSPMSSTFNEPPTQYVCNKFEETTKALKELQNKFESQKSKRLENEKLLKEKYDELQSTITELNIKNATLSSQLEHSNERYEVLESSCGSFRREAELLREKALGLSKSCGKLESSYEDTRQQLSEVKEKLQKSEVMYDNLKQERNIIKEAEARLMAENKSLINQQKGQSILLTNLQTIQNNLERQEYETKTRLTGHMDGLEREITVLKQKTYSEAEHHAKVLQSWESQVKETRNQLETEVNSHKETTEQLSMLRNELNETKTKTYEKESQLSASEARLNEILSRDAEEDRDSVLAQTLREEKERHTSEVYELKENLIETKSRNTILENQIELTKQHLEQHKTMLEANGNELAELNKASKLYQEKMEGEKTESQERLSKLQMDLASFEKRNSEYEKENVVLKTKLAEETANLQEQVKVMTAELKVAIERAEACSENEKRVKQIYEEQKPLAAEARDKYEKELIYHASDIQALTEAKEQIKTFNARLEETEEKWKASVNTLEESQTSWEEQKKIQAQELEKLLSRCEELVHQNSLLHDQGKKLSEQVLSAQSRSVTDVHIPSASSEEQDKKSVQDLWEIIRFIRKEKEISETKSEMIQCESVRYQQRLEYVEKQQKETEAVLGKERERSKLSATDSKEYEEIMEKVEKLGEIEELNKVLTNDKESLKKKISNIESQVKKLENEINPLKENIVSLTSHKDMLVGEKTALKSEIQRWKSRANQLIEQCKQQPDPEDLKKLQEEKKQFLSQQKLSKDEGQKLKVQVEALRNEISRLQAEINIKKTETGKIQEELSTLKSDIVASSKLEDEIGNLKKEVEAKTEEVNEKVKTITQLKKIARRYKSQCDELSKKKDDVVETSTEETSLNTESNAEQENMIKTLNEEKQTLQEEVDKLMQLATASKEREEKSKKTFNSATKRIQQLMAFKDKCSSENEEVKKSLEDVRQEKEVLLQAANEREMRLTVLKTQFQGKQSRVEKELKEKHEELEKTINEKAKLQEREAAKESEIEKQKKRLQQFQRILLQTQQKLKTQASLRMAVQAQHDGSGGSGGPGAKNLSKEMVTSPSPSIAPPTAAVKPTSTPSTSAPVRPINTPTASIRPMAMTTAVQPTPTATVPPTVTTQSTVIVSAVTELITTSSVDFRSQSSTSTTVVAAVTPSVSSEITSSPSVSIRPITSSPIIAMATSSMEVSEERSADIHVSSEERPSVAEVSPDQAILEQSSMTDITSEEQVDSPQHSLGMKRPRDHDSTTGNKEAKKARTLLEERQADEDSDDKEELGGVGEQKTIAVEEDEQEPEIVCIDTSDDDDEAEERIEREMAEEDDDDQDDDIVEVLDDDVDIKEVFGEEVNEPDDEQDICDSGVVVVRVSTAPTPPISGQRPQDEAVMSSQPLPAMTQVRLVRSQSHLAPFSLGQGQSSNSGFDDPDDCMVPSTPTLFIPKRSDGFSEMISSPRVHHPSFLFGPSAESSLNQTGGLAMGMSEEGLRVDDTRFDIMASSGDDVDMGFDNVVPDLDEASSTIEFLPEDEGTEASSLLISVVSSTSGEQHRPADFSEQNVPETSEELEELAASDDIKLELSSGEGNDEDDATVGINQAEKEPLADPSKDACVEETSCSSVTPETSSASTRITMQTSQETRPKPNVVQLRRPAADPSTQLPNTQVSGAQALAGRRIIRVQGTQGRGRGNQRRGRGSQRSTPQ